MQLRESGVRRRRVHRRPDAARRDGVDPHSFPGDLDRQRLGERTTVEGEFRAWIPVRRTDFAGDVLRYGVGLGYDVYRSCNLRVTPVTEFVGWTVTDGKELAVAPDGTAAVKSAGGDTFSVAIAPARTW